MTAVVRRPYCLHHDRFGRGHLFCLTELRLAPCTGCVETPAGLQRDTECAAHGVEADAGWWRTPTALRELGVVERIDLRRIAEADYVASHGPALGDR